MSLEAIKVSDDVDYYQVLSAVEGEDNQEKAGTKSFSS